MKKIIIDDIEYNLIPSENNNNNKENNKTEFKIGEWVIIKQDFFGKHSFLTVSGQLNGETYACALSDIYTFGPTFRAENSNTSRHLAEFWMIEPEMAFADIVDDMDCAESYIKFLLQWVLEKCHSDSLRFCSCNESGR